jgi:hypothetical protein
LSGMGDFSRVNGLKPGCGHWMIVECAARWPKSVFGEADASGGLKGAREQREIQTWPGGGARFSTFPAKAF